jgi:predicted O-methyltransferase YrrM
MSLLSYAHKFLRKRKVRRFRKQMERLRHGYAPTAASVDTMRSHPDFARVIRKIRGAGTASLSHFENGYDFEGGLYIQQHPDEFASLIVFLQDRGPFPNYLEIGSASGGTCLFLTQCLDIGQVTSLDDGQHRDAWLQDQHFSQIPGCNRFLGDSHGEEARQYMERMVREPLDLAFIDGDHSYEGVKQDIELVLPYCRPGALLVLHDSAACEGVAQAWHNIVTEKSVRPVAEFIGTYKPLGLAVGEVLSSQH